MKKTKILAALLSAAMVVTSAAVSALAEEGSATDPVEWDSNSVIAMK